MTALVSPELSHLGTLRPSAVYRQLRYVLIVARYKRRFFASCSCLEIKGNFTNTLVFYTSVSFVLLPIYFSTPTFCLCVSLSFFVVHFSFPIFHFRFFFFFFWQGLRCLGGVSRRPRRSVHGVRCGGQPFQQQHSGEIICLAKLLLQQMGRGH